MNLRVIVKVFCILLLFLTSGYAQIRLPKLIDDGMVIQRDSEVKIWGWASKNESVLVSFLGEDYKTVADSIGYWEVLLKPKNAGGPYMMRLKASNIVVIKDILIGDVWVCSGQSNMELPMKRVQPIYENEIANSENKFIRLFSVPQKYNFIKRQIDFESGSWRSANPQSILDFSAVAYFFAKEIYQKYKVPVGLINTSLGGSPAEAWMSEESLKKFPHYFNEAQRFKDDNLIKRIEANDHQRIKAWYDLLRQKDEGYQNPVKNWTDPKLNSSNWKSMKIPGYWSDTKLGNVNGVVWFRKKIILPASAAGRSAKLNLGRIVDADSVFVNGVFIGTTSYQYPPRRYIIPEKILKKGENVIVVRVINNSGRGGFVQDKPYEIIVGNKKIDLTGNWQYRLGSEMDPLASQTFIRWKPTGLFNSMLAPLLNFRIKGVIWYQGESNVSRAKEYAELFPALISDWRYNWGQGDFPFLFVQLANFLEPNNEPSESDWALLRESQFKTLSVPNTGMAVTIDLGEWNDIHPLNKKDVGKRLALAAQKIAYNDDVIHSGPIFQSFKIEKNKVVLTFNNLGSGLICKDNGELKYFSIAGQDSQFVWAKAEIAGNEVIVWNELVLSPIAVRYAWANNPEGANLYNKEGLPASPFRTDDF